MTFKDVRRLQVLTRYVQSRDGISSSEAYRKAQAMTSEDIAAVLVDDCCPETLVSIPVLNIEGTLLLGTPTGEPIEDEQELVEGESELEPLTVESPLVVPVAGVDIDTEPADLEPELDGSEPESEGELEVSDGD